jgi:hypothetical protein
VYLHLGPVGWRAVAEGSWWMATNTSHGNAANLVAMAFSCASACPAATWAQEYPPVRSSE